MTASLENSQANIKRLLALVWQALGIATGGSSSPTNPFLSQAQWYFDFSNVTGLASDSNSGLDAAHPLLTWNGGFVPRVGKNGAGPWAVTPTLHFMSSQPSPWMDPISFLPSQLPFAPNPPFTNFAAIVVGTVTAKVAAGNNLSAVIAKNRSGTANGQLLTATFGGAAAGQVAALDFLQNTSAGKVSNSWARTNIGTNEWTLFQPITAAVPGTFPALAEFDTWAAGDTVAVSSIPKVYCDAMAGPVLVYNCEIAQVNEQGVNINGGTFTECRMSGSIDASRTKIAIFTNCTLAFQGNRYQAPSCIITAGGTAGTSGATFHLGAGSAATLDAYLGTTGGGPTYCHELTIEAAYLDSGSLLTFGTSTLDVTDARVAGSPLMWGPGSVDFGDNPFLILPGNAVASILNQGGAAGCLQSAGLTQGLFLDTTVSPAVYSGLRNITAVLLDTDGHAGGGFREGASGAVVCRGGQGSGTIRSGIV